MASRTSRRRALAGLLLALVTAGVVVLSCDTERPERVNANAVIVLIDALRADHLGCYGYPEGTSPEIDRLARGGLQFSRAYTTAPWTYSSTASLVTGLYPAAHGAFTPGEERNHTTNPYPPALSPAIDTVAEVVQRHGWRTALFSANAYVGLGIEQGFEKYLLEQYDAEQQANAALQWMESLAPEENFFSIVHFIDVHEPNRPPRLYRKMFPGAAGIQPPELKTYGSSWGAYGTGHPTQVVGYAEYRTKRIDVYNAALRFTDHEVGRLVQRIQEMRPDEETTILVTADHGEEFWDHAELENALYKDPRGMYGLAHGHSFFEELMRIPLIFTGGQAPEGRLSPTLVSLVDVTPTVLDDFGIQGTPEVQGVSLMPELDGDTLPQRTFLLDALVYGRDKRATVDPRYKLIASDQEPTVLFDLAEDPAERVDVSQERPETTTAAVARLDSLYQASLALGVELRGSEVEAAVKPSDSQVEMLRALGYVE